MAALGQPLFYARDIARTELVSLVYGALQQPAVDTVEVTDEAGGAQDREQPLTDTHGCP